MYLNNAGSLPPTGVGIGYGANKDWYTAVPNLISTQQVAVAQNPWIMVINDSVTVRKILETCLGREGYEVKSFSDGIEVMRWLTGPAARVPTLIILDIGLPKMDGYEVACRLKARPQFSTTVIVMLSRRDGVIDRLKGRLVGAKDYLTKPFKTQDLIATVEAYMSNSLSR